MKHKIIIADRQFLTREAIRELIIQHTQAEVSVVEEPNELWNYDTNYFDQIDTIFLQIEDDDLKNLHKIIAVKEANNCDFILLTDNVKPDSAKKLFNSKIKYIITKQCSEDEILDAYQATKTENRFYCNTVLNLFSEENEDCDPTILSPRELEIVELITKGLKTNEIAEKLFLSVHTINSHRKNILKKLNLKSPAELIIYAIDSGLASK